MTYLLLFACAAVMIFFYKFCSRLPSIDYQHPRILMYHMVSEHKKGAKFNKLRVTPDNFEKQISWLAKNGWSFVTMRELFNQEEHEANHSKCIALTFDDGFEDNYTNAFPILKKYHAKATLYLVVDRHNRDWSTYKKAHHNSGELMHEPKLNDEQVHEMVASGVFELGGHTTTHANLATLSADDKQAEIADCRQQLEQTFNTQVTSFAYPFGIYSPNDPALVATLGYKSAVTTVEGIDTELKANAHELKRIKISGKDSLRIFKRRLNSGVKR